MISPEFFSNPIIFANEDFQNRVIQGFFETFTDLFPGVEKCIQNYEFVCNITSQTFDAIMKNIAQKIHNSGIRKEKNDVEAFLGQYFYILDPVFHLVYFCQHKKLPKPYESIF